MQSTQTPPKKTNEIKFALWFFLIIGAIVILSAAEEDYRAKYWIETDAIIQNIEVKHASMRHSRRGSYPYLTELTLVYYLDNTTHTGKLKLADISPEYKKTQILKIIRNPKDPGQIDFPPKKEDVEAHFFAGIISLLLSGLCALFLRRNKARERYSSHVT